MIKYTFVNVDQVGLDMIITFILLNIYKKLFLNATFHLPMANCIRHVVT